MHHLEERTVSQEGIPLGCHQLLLPEDLCILRDRYICHNQLVCAIVMKVIIPPAAQPPHLFLSGAGIMGFQIALDVDRNEIIQTETRSILAHW